MKRQQFLIFLFFSLSLKAQTLTADVNNSIIPDEAMVLQSNLWVSIKGHKINFSIPKDLMDNNNLMFDLYDNHQQLVSTSCMECSRFVDVSNLAPGIYSYVIKSDKRNLKSGKLLLN